jgi:integrase
MPGSRPGHWRRPTSGGSCERSRAARRRGTGAIATVFFYTGLRLSELAALEVGDLSVSARRGRLRVRSGKGDADRASRCPLDDVRSGPFLPVRSGRS